MYTSIDKAIAALLMSIVSLLAILYPPISQYVTTEMVTLVITIITPVVVYLVPNRRKPTEPPVPVQVVSGPTPNPAPPSPTGRPTTDGNSQLRR